MVLGSSKSKVPAEAKHRLFSSLDHFRIILKCNPLGQGKGLNFKLRAATHDLAGASSGELQATSNKQLDMKEIIG